MKIATLKKLGKWFCKNKEDLPWRPKSLEEKRDPYRVWISETMLQQTQVSTVKNYFTRWVQRFPNIKELSLANEEEVLKYWQGLGYYSRAKNLLKTSKIIYANFALNKDFPRTRMELEKLPGIGAYTAGAILSLSYHKKEAILDGNLIRIFSRFYGLDFLPTDKRKDIRPKEIYWNYARKIAQNFKSYIYNEALMELGRTTCKLKSPNCVKCPLNKECKAYLDGNINLYPPSKKLFLKSWNGVALIIKSLDKKILAIHGMQAFFKNQFTIPHFEYAKTALAGIIAPIENFVPENQIISVKKIGEFNHNITNHKINCQILEIDLNTKSKQVKIPILKGNENVEIKWIEFEKTTEFFANSFSLKALRSFLK